MTSLKIYPEFVANQTLSHENLNAVFAYLDREERNTRHLLIGTGILCGFKLNANGSNSSLSPGIAITTDGHILSFKETFNFKYYRNFEDKGPGYPPINGKAYEVLDKVPEDENVEDLDTFTQLDIDFREGVVVLYLEDHLKDIESCEGESCDNKGKEHRLSLKVLIIPKSEAAVFVEDNSGFLADIKNEKVARHPKYNIGLLKIRRPQITPKIVKLSELKDLYKEIIKKAQEDLDNFMDSVRKAFSNEYSQINYSSYRISNIVSDLITDQSDFQQIYDWLETLFRAINEWIALVQDTHLQCVNKKRVFPRHVFTGSLTPQDFPPQLYRHYFEKAQTDTKSLDALELQSLMAERVHLIMESVEVNKLDRLAVLPEKRSSGKLADRAIPYFQNYSAIKRYWNPESDLIQRLNFDNFGQNKEALHYSFEDKDFFRIEGHVGLDRKTALDALVKLRADHNLEFDIRTVYVDEPETLEKHDCCSYETLRLIYQIVIQGFKSDLLDTYKLYETLEKYSLAGSFPFSPKMRQIAKDYEIIDYRHLDIFKEKEAEKTEETEAPAGKEALYEALGKMAKNDSFEMSSKLKDALLENEKSIVAGKTASPQFLENEKMLMDFAIENGFQISNISESAQPLEVSMKAMTHKTSPLLKESTESKDLSRNTAVSEKINELLKAAEETNNPDLLEKAKSLEAEFAEQVTVTKENTFEIIKDGFHNILILNALKNALIVEANPHQSSYDPETSIEKTLSSILVDIHDLQLLLPDNISQFNADKLDLVIDKINKKSTSIYEHLETVGKSKNCHYGVKLVFHILTKLNYNNWYFQLLQIAKMFKEKIETPEVHNILANVVQNNPGLEHRAGVPIGGTFFLLTSQGQKRSKTIIQEELSFEEIVALLKKDESKSAAPLLFEIERQGIKSTKELYELIEKEKLFSIIGITLERQRSKALEIFRDDNHADDRVIGDFCLNSTIECCDVKYIVHTDIRLKSPKDFYCDSDSKINLDVHPRGGTIFGPGTSENGHTYIFDPSHPDVKIGENILTYAIADERVDLVIEVLKHPTAEIKVISKVINDGEAVIEVDSRTTGADKFEWAIGTSKYVEGREKHTFTVPVKEDSLETVIRLRASNKACSVVDSESIKLTDVQLILNEKNFCSTDPAIKLEGKPQGGSFSGDGVKGTNFDPALIEFPAKETVLNIPVTYTFESDSETKEVSVFKHPEAKIELLSEEYRDGVAFFKVENTTVPFKGYSYQWEVNGENFAGKQILEEAVKLVNNQVDIKLKAFHLKFQKCIDIAQLILEEKTEEDDTTEKPDEEKFAKTFDAIKELNSQNIKFFNDFKKDVVSGKFNDSVLTSTEMKQTQSLLNFIDNVEVKELAMNAANAVKSEMDDFQAKLKEVSEAELFGPEFTHLALRLVSIFNISSISTDKIALGNNFKSMNASIKKMFENNQEMRYSTQRLIDKEFWMNNENFTQISTFWKSIEK